MTEIRAIQSAVKDFGFDGWLLGDFRNSNPLARRVLGLEARPAGSRRWFYFIPAQGDPRKLVHRIESAALDSLPGEKTVYSRWQEFEAGLARLVSGANEVAMEYSARNANPYVAKMDAGTIELVRSFGCQIQSSGDLVQMFEALWDDEQWAMHKEADTHTRSAFDLAWGLIARRVASGEPVSELAVQQAILGHFASHSLTTYSPPNCSVNEHAGDPHYEPSPATDRPIKEGDLVLIDLWAKVDRPRAVYSDLTRMGYVGKTVPSKYQALFKIVADARDAAISCVEEAFAQKRTLRGFEVDDAARGVVESAGYGHYFVHRTGHSMAQEVHGNGAHMDNLETHEERLVLKRAGFTIEPGLYFPEFGLRSEINIHVDAQGKVHVTGGPAQTEILPILA